MGTDSVDDIISAIESAFAGVQRGRVTLHEAEAMDNYATDSELAIARKRDPELDWKLVPETSIEACRDAMSYLDAESWRFYLPAFMRSGLRQLGARRNLAIDVAIYSLDTGLGPPELDAPRFERFRLLAPQQVRVVRSFLSFASAREEHCDSVVAEHALEAYWAGAGE